MTKEEVGLLIRGIAPTLKRLEKRIAALEARPKGLVYLGTWTDGEEYGVGDCVTRSGSLWTSRVNANKAIPGADGGVSWTLCAKRGKDGKDLR